MKKMLAVVLIGGLVCSFAGCKKKEEKPLLPPGHPSMGGAMPAGAGMPGENGMSADKPKDRVVTIPKEVQAKWSKVKLAIEDKIAKAEKEYTVDIGSDLAVPDTKVKIRVLAFLPQFVMGDAEITSASNEPKMPAAQVLIQEPGKPEWKGWLFATAPDMHPYKHERIAVRLVGGVSK